MAGNFAVLLEIVAATLGCMAFLIFSLRKLKKKQNRKNEHFDKVSQTIANSRNRRS